MKRGQCVALSVIAAYILFLLDLAWFQFPSQHPSPNAIPFRSMMGDWKDGGRPFVVNFLGNIVAFIPMGMMPATAWPRRARAWHAAAFSLALSTLIEAVQYQTGRRVADVDDLILNTAGGLLGYGLLRLHRAWRTRPAAAERKGPAGGECSPGGPGTSLN